MVLLALPGMNAADCRERDPGDTCDTAFAITGLPFSDQQNTGFFEDDYDAACPYEGSTAPDIVYVFSPVQDILIDADLCADATDFDTKLYIFENDCAAGSLIACCEDFCRTESMTWTYVSILQQVSLTAGNDYYFVVDGNRWSDGNVEFALRESSGDPQLPDPEW